MPTPPEQGVDPVSSRRTVPDMLCYGRILGSVALVATSWWGLENISLALVVLMILSDWLDGTLAYLLDQRTEFGARLDSAADACFYTAVLISLLHINPVYVTDSAAWIGLALLSYVVNVGVCLAKFNKWPGYHTWLAKITWGVAAVVTVGGFVGWGAWLPRVAASLAVVANMEQMVISLTLLHYRVNVSCFPVALQLRKESAADSST